MPVLMLAACDCDDGNLSILQLDAAADGALAQDGSTDLDGSSVDGSTSVPDGGIGDSGVERCSTIRATLRDFRGHDVGGHIDFENHNTGLVTGAVRDRLDGDRKPVFAHESLYAGIASQDSFRQWYRNVPEVNMAFDLDLPLTEESPGVFVFEDSSFFPLDGMGFGNSGPDRSNPVHNFHFTTEIHTSFVYEGGEVFTFRGDDDVFIFVDGKLALDLGGIHGVVAGTVDMDSLGLVQGETYLMDVFHAERHFSKSNFRVETTIECFKDPILI